MIRLRFLVKLYEVYLLNRTDDILSSVKSFPIGSVGICLGCDDRQPDSHPLPCFPEDVMIVNTDAHCIVRCNLDP